MMATPIGTSNPAVSLQIRIDNLMADIDGCTVKLNSCGEDKESIKIWANLIIASSNNLDNLLLLAQQAGNCTAEINL